jgi:8-oxo-dGTP diphosphatase
MADWKAVPVFGVPETRLPHVVRPSAYGLVLGPEGSLAIVRTGTGAYLPGGGIVDTESPEDAVCREAREECGLTVILGLWRRAAIDHVTAAREGTHFEKRSTFCDATVVGSTTELVEPDHVLAWVNATSAVALLTPPSHRWAVAEWMTDRARLPRFRPAG